MARKSKKKAPELFEFTETIVGLSAGDQLDRDYFAYARAVVEDRAIPAAADGLKPVHRRILWDMWTQRLLPDRPFVKTARVVGDTMALFHPHGDASIADALARLAQPFSNLVPLLDFHGNVGSPDFSPAAPRYTETRLGQFGMMLLDEVDQGVVQMVENYEGSTVEPKVLPATYPNLLVNGANGIAVGLSSYLPPHDPREVCEAALMLLDRKSASVDELMTVLPGPSFPSECTVTNGDELTDIYRSGQGRVVVRGAWLVEPVGRGRQQIIITSLPYADTTLGSVEKFIAQVGDALDNGDLAGITAFNDESSNGLTRISVELAAGVDAEMVVPGLLRFTNLQVTNKVQMHFLDENDTVRLYNLRSALQAWVAHRIRVVVSRSEYRLEKIAERLHRLRGFLAVLVDIDETIAIVRTSKTRAVARERLIERFSIDESQANAVLDLNLGQLTEDAVIEFQTEATALEAEQKKLELLLSSETRQRSLVARELKDTMDAFDRPAAAGHDDHDRERSEGVEGADGARHAHHALPRCRRVDAGDRAGFQGEAQDRAVADVRHDDRDDARRRHRQRAPVPHTRRECRREADRSAKRPVWPCGRADPLVARARPADRTAARHVGRSGEADRDGRLRRRRPQRRHLDRQARR